MGRGARGVEADVAGKVQKFRHLSPKATETDDGTLKARVESTLFRDPEVPKGDININVEHGVVVLRGEVRRPEQIRDLESAVEEIPGVLAVENLLHLPGTPARMS
jgi:osmotically-inducible protein OsmY